MVRFALAMVVLAGLPALVEAAPRRAPAAAEAPAQTDATARPAGGTLVVLAPARPFTALSRAARSLMAADIAEARTAGEQPLVLVGTAGLGPASDRQALFVQLQSPRECGSSGCGTTVFLWVRGAYRKILDQSDGPLLTGPGRTGGMLDLQSDHDRFVWDGREYKSTRPAPEIDLRPRRR